MEIFVIRSTGETTSLCSVTVPGARGQRSEAVAPKTESEWRMRGPFPSLCHLITSGAARDRGDLGGCGPAVGGA